MLSGRHHKPLCRRLQRLELLILTHGVYQCSVGAIKLLVIPKSADSSALRSCQKQYSELEFEHVGKTN